MKNKIEELKLAYNNYEKCIDCCAAEHITGYQLVHMKELCQSIVKDIDDILKTL